MVYTGNGREIGAGDTIGATLLPLAIVRGDGPILDRFTEMIRSFDPSPGGFPPYHATLVHGHLVSRYPLAVPIVAMPLVVPQLALLDWLRPNWDATAAGTLRGCRWMAKNAAAAIVALTAVLLLDFLRQQDLARTALAATLTVALGSPLWTTGAQSLWQHGPAAVCLTAALLLLSSPASPARLAGAGVALGTLVSIRMVDVVFAVPIATWLALRRARDLAWFVPPAAAIVLITVTYNVEVFGTPLGGQAQLEALHSSLQGLPGSWGPFVDGASGTLVSPNRGLLVFCPWIAVTLLLLPAFATRLAARPLLVALCVGLLADFVVLAKYSSWWAGWCFGPRFWVDAMPIFAILFAMALDWGRARSRPAAAALIASAALAVVVETLGATHYPSSWNGVPVSAGRAHGRLWDWRDSELTRELREGARRPELPLFGLPPA